jgi:hypothetical protein
MALEGTLDALGLAEVLDLLAGTAKTGCLRVEGDGGRGQVWVRDGAVTSATSDRAAGTPLDEVLCDLLRFEQGAFAFELDERAPGTDGDGSGHGAAVADLLERAGRLLDERRELEAVVPSIDHHVALRPSLDDGADEVTISAAQWTALVAIGPGRSVRDLAGALEVTEMTVLRTVHDLVSSGLTAVHEVAPSRARGIGRRDGDHRDGDRRQAPLRAWPAPEHDTRWPDPPPVGATTA